MAAEDPHANKIVLLMRSILKRGLGNTLKVAWAWALDGASDRINGTDTLAFVERDDLDVAPETKPHAQHVSTHVGPAPQSVVQAPAHSPREREDVISLFNPFDAVALEKVMSGLTASWARCPRDLWIIYRNAVYGEIIDNHLHAAQKSQRKCWGLDFTIYQVAPHGPNQSTCDANR